MTLPPRRRFEPPSTALANKYFADKSVDLDDICATLKISKTTLYCYVEIATGRLSQSRKHLR